MSVRTRFAPSPTGYLHIGGVRTALFNWLFARAHGGQFILRIDDTDQQRNVEEALAADPRRFRWLGIDWDEGPEVEAGRCGPYYQSQRADLYQAAVERAARRPAHAYRDFATPEEIQAEREAAQQEKRPFVYSRRWMAETPEDAARSRPKAARPWCGLKMPREGTAGDRRPGPRPGRVRVGPASRTTSSSGPTARACTTWPAWSTITPWRSSHVIRAEEHLSNTPRQIFIAQSLGYELPAVRPSALRGRAGQQDQAEQAEAGQVPEEPRLRPTGRARPADRRATRDLATDAETFNPVIVDFYEQVGYLPEALVNYLLLLGWSLDDKTEDFSRDGNDRAFFAGTGEQGARPASIRRSCWPSRRGHMQQLPIEQKVALCCPYLQQAGWSPIRRRCDTGPGTRRSSRRPATGSKSPATSSTTPSSSSPTTELAVRREGI